MRMGRVLALVAGALAVCILGLLAAVYFTRDEDNIAPDNLLAERFTKQVNLAEQPDEELHGLVDLRVLTNFPWDRVLVVAQGTPQAVISRKLGYQWTGTDVVDNGDFLIFLDGRKIARWADYRGNGRFAGFKVPIDEFPRAHAVFRVHELVIRPA